MEQSRERALELYRKAAAGGRKEAKEALERLGGGEEPQPAPGEAQPAPQPAAKAPAAPEAPPQAPRPTAAPAQPHREEKKRRGWWPFGKKK